MLERGIYIRKLEACESGVFPFFYVIWGKSKSLSVDRARWHRGKRIDEFFHMHKQFNLHYLPPYHPELNFQESLWRMMRYEETTNVYFESMDKLITGVFKRSQSWKPKKITSLCHLI